MLDPLLLLAIGLAQSEDLTLSIGALDDTNTNAGMFLGTTYAHRIAHGLAFKLSGQIDFAASPNRKSSLIAPLASRDVASLYVVPGVHLGSLPDKRISPFVAGGVGLAQYEQ